MFNTLIELIRTRDAQYDDATERAMADFEYIRQVICNCFSLEPRYTSWETIDDMPEEKLLMFIFRAINFTKQKESGETYEQVIHVGIPYEVIELCDRHVLEQYILSQKKTVVFPDGERVDAVVPDGEYDVVDDDEEYYSAMDSADEDLFAIMYPNFNPKTVH